MSGGHAIEVAVEEGPIGPSGAARVAGGDGAMALFEGVVRGTENGRVIEGLEYTAYEPMAQRQLERIAAGLLDLMEISTVRVVHSLGFVPVGAVSLRCVVTAPHRRTALDAVGVLIDDLKRDVPIWKSARPATAVGRGDPGGRAGG